MSNKETIKLLDIIASQKARIAKLGKELDQKAAYNMKADECIEELKAELAIYIEVSQFSHDKWFAFYREVSRFSHDKWSAFYNPEEISDGQ